MMFPLKYHFSLLQVALLVETVGTVLDLVAKCEAAERSFRMTPLGSTNAHDLR